MTEWEQHFQKLQHGLTFDENNPNVTESSEKENCNKKLILNDAGPSQNKSYDRHKTHSLDECAENMVKRLRAVPKHLKINKKKTLDAQPESQKFPHETFNTAEPQTKFQNFCLCNTRTFGIQMKKTSFNWEYGKNVTIAKDIMNYI